MNATNLTTLWPNQAALDTASDRHVTCDDGRRLDLELYRDCAHQRAAALRSQAIAEARIALRNAVRSWVHGASRMLSASHRGAGSSAGSRSIG